MFAIHLPPEEVGVFLLIYGEHLPLIEVGAL